MSPAFVQLTQPGRTRSPSRHPGRPAAGEAEGHTEHLLGANAVPFMWGEYLAQPHPTHEETGSTHKKPATGLRSHIYEVGQPGFGS